jgi:hypothetical protein
METSHHYGICIVAITTGFSNGNGVGIAYDASSATHNGNLFDYDNNLWRLGAYGGSGKDICFYVYGIVAGGINFQNLANSSNENGINCVFSVDCTPIGALATMSGYIFSYDISGSYVNDTWTAFSNTTSETLNINKVLVGSLGQTVHYTFFGNDSDNLWTQSSIATLTLQATVTFRFTEGGALWRNSVSIANGTATTYTTATTLTMLALQNSLYGFISFNWSNTVASSTSNNYTFSVLNQTTFWAFMNLTDRYTTGYSDGWTAGNATGYAAGYSAGYNIGWAEGNATGYSDGWTAGNATGYAAGYSDGYAAGYDVGFIDGVNSFVWLGNATEGEVLSGYTFYSNTSDLRTGTYEGGGVGEYSFEDIEIYSIIAGIISAVIVGLLVLVWASKSKSGY